MSAERGEGHMKGVAKYIVYGIFVLFGLFLFASGFPWLLELPFHLIFGWFIHGSKALPPFLGKWEAAILPAGCVVLATILIHRFILRWLQLKRPSLDWRVLHTVSVLTLLFLGSGAAISASGMVHQFFWLGGGKVIENNRRTDIVIAASNGKQVMLLLLDYYQQNGRYPKSFEEAGFKENNETFRELWWIQTKDGGVPEPFVLLRPGSTEIALDEDPLIVSPLLRDGTKRVVGFGDSSVRTVTAKGFAKIMEARVKEAAIDE